MTNWQHAVVSDAATPAVYVEVKDGSNLFPLYLYPDAAKSALFDADEPTDAPGGRRPNLAPEFIAELERRLGMTFIPDGKGNCSAAVPAAVATASRRSTSGQDARSTASEDAGGTTQTADVQSGMSRAMRPRFRELKIRDRGRLPHWEMEGGIYFVTFRLADSLPQSVLNFFKAERENIIRTAQQMGRDLSPSEHRRLAELFSDQIENHLDAGAGSCHLRQPQIAEMVANALRFFDDQRYRLFAWCVMPNHVHVVMRPLHNHHLGDILHSWKSFTAKEANRMLGLGGTFWEREYYDHLVRDEEEFYRIINYVADNPKQANLPDWPWVEVNPPGGRGGQDAHSTAVGTTALQAELTFGPEDVFAYMYAVFHSPTYRSRYSEFLKIDFPRLPLTSNPALFRVLCAHGARLVRMHLLEERAPDLASFPAGGTNTVEGVRYTVVNPKNETNS